MAVTDLVRAFSGRGVAALGLLDFGGVEQRRDNRCRTDADRDPRLDQLGPPFLVSPIVAHSILADVDWSRPYALLPGKGSAA